MGRALKVVLRLTGAGSVLNNGLSKPSPPDGNAGSGGDSSSRSCSHDTASSGHDGSCVAVHTRRFTTPTDC